MKNGVVHVAITTVPKPGLVAVLFKWSHILKEIATVLAAEVEL